MKIGMPVGIRSLLKHWIFYHNFFILAVLLLLIAAGYWFREPIFELVTVQKVVTEEEAIISAAEGSEPAVVSVVAQAVIEDLLSGETITEEQGAGTGFIVRDNGLIITNRHVVADTELTYVVVTSKGDRYDVKKIDRDTLYDLAFLKIEASGLPSLSLGDSDELRLGQTVVAIGNALGEFSNTVTRGVVSGLGRGVLVEEEQLDNVIQTDAAINLGNSGGPLLNLSGEVIGVNVAKVLDVDNIGFSIPINLIKPVLEQFEREGRIVRPFLGVSFRIYDEGEAAFWDLPAAGAYVTEVVAGSGAAKAGVRAGDVITAVNGEEVSLKNSLIKLIASKKIGDTITLTVVRGNQELSLQATLGESPQQ